MVPVVLGFDTVVAFELDLSERPKSRQSYSARPKSQLSHASRPKSQQSCTSQPKSQQSSSSWSNSWQFRPSLTQNRPSSKQNDVESKQCLNNKKSESERSDHSELLKITGVGKLQYDKDSEKTRAVTAVRKHVSMRKPVSRPKSACETMKSDYENIIKRTYSYVLKSRPKTPLGRSKSNANLQKRPKTCPATAWSVLSMDRSKSATLSSSSPRYHQPTTSQSQVQYVPKGPLEGDSTGLLGSSMAFIGTQPRATWSMADSQIGINNPMLGNVNTPRILELDINRMMIGQNTISAQIGAQGLSNDRLVNAANNNLRSYMTVNRPGPSSAGKTERPLSGSRQSPRPSSSPTNHSSSTAKRVRLSDVEIPSMMATNEPLPPIGGTADRPRSGSGKGKQSPPRIPVGNELPESPPGSSLRHSPPGDDDDIEITSPEK